MKWEERPLGEVLRPHDDWVSIEPETTYREVTVRLWGKGADLRRECLGAEIGAPTRNRVKSGQFIISKIDARNGAFALVPEFLDGAVVTSDFPTFEVNPDHALPGFVGWLSKTERFVDLCRRASEGTTNRVRLKLERFLTTRIPLPPVVEQRQIVAKLDAAAERIARIEAAQSANAEDFDRLLESLLFDNQSATPTPMRELVIPRAPDTKVEGDETYDFAGVYSFGRGVFRSITKTGLDFAYTALTQVCAGEFTYPKLMAWEGAFGIIPPECDGCFVSPEFPVFGVRQDLVFPELLDAYFRSPRVWPEIAAISSGTNARRRRLQPSSFLNYRFPLPSREAQKRIRVTLEARTRLRAAQNSRAADLAALMPSLLDQAFKGGL
jgi:type I restriction enzyme S subunit